MSNTSQALDHAQVAARAGDTDQARYWADRARGFVRQDARLPMKVSVQPNGCGLLLRCTTCGREETVHSLAQAATFGEHHYYCGSRVLVWGCGRCNGLNLDRDNRCRYCEQHRTGEPTLKSGTVWIPDQREYSIQLTVRYEVARVYCDSMLRARRAARAMFPMQELVVTLSHQCGASCAACTEPKHLPPEVKG